MAIRNRGCRPPGLTTPGLAKSDAPYTDPRTEEGRDQAQLLEFFDRDEYVQAPSPESWWWDEERGRLDALLESVVRTHPERYMDGTPVPWQEGIDARLQAHGGMVNLDREHQVIVGKGGYASHSMRNRSMTAEAVKSFVHGDRDVRVEAPSGDNVPEDLAPPSGDSWGTDRLLVRRAASQSFESRTFMMSGRIERSYDGGLVRMASMEGVMVGGAFVRAIAGVSLNLSGLCSGDVYGGAARAAIVRLNIGLLHYRAAQNAAWATTFYARMATFAIEPLITVVNPPKSNTWLMGKATRLGAVMARMSSVARALCPAADILAGLALALFSVGATLAALIAKALGQPPVAAPPVVLPRVHNRYYTLDSTALASMIYF